jgi:hypothetical protein
MVHDTAKKFYISVEGIEFELNSEVITVAQIRELGNIPADQPIVEESPDVAVP